MLGQLKMLKIKYEEAVEARKKTQNDIKSFRPDVDKAISAKIPLEKQLENLEVELAFLQRVHKEERIESIKLEVKMTKDKIAFAGISGPAEC
ncbi:Desmin [Channa argus]|uniref:Desmin n=1 Tax=Channa argus TaxID=215402 RepID=A0A6G1QKW8_CHAAH|nr:Desmin [Channa argus]